VGLGLHEADVLPEQHMPLKKAEYVFSVLYVRIRPLSEGSIDKNRTPH